MNSPKYQPSWRAEAASGAPDSGAIREHAATLNLHVIVHSDTGQLATVGSVASVYRGDCGFRDDRFARRTVTEAQITSQKLEEIS